jgi:hypothetical protein
MTARMTMGIFFSRTTAKKTGDLSLEIVENAR